LSRRDIKLVFPLRLPYKGPNKEACVQRMFQCVAVVLCLQAALCLSSRADGFTNIISGVSTNVSGYYVVGEADSFNYLEINSGGALMSLAGLLADQSSSSNNSALITGSNSLWNCTGGIAIGENGSGNQLTITNGGHLNSVGGYIGDGIQADSNEVIVTGSDSVWNNGNNNYLIVGNGGSGNQLLILDGAQVISNTRLFVGGNLGDYQGSNNTLMVSGVNSLFTTSASLFVGSGPGNKLVISNGAMFTCVAATVGFNEGTFNGVVFATSSNNAVSITGSNTVWNNSGSLAFGLFGGSNQLTISAGAVVSNTWVVVGGSVLASNNSAVIDGVGTLWNCNGYLDWGDSSSGNGLTVTNGARINTTGVSIGGGSSNQVVVTGNNTVWENTGSLLFGEAGSDNQLQILSGAQILGNSGVALSYSGGSSNVLIVSGPNSQLINGGSFSMGNYMSSGAGNRLVVSNGAKFTCGSAVVGSNNLVLVTGSNTVWSNNGSLQFSSYGVNNQFIADAGAAVSNGDCYIGNYSTARNNAVLVSGTGTTWNAGCVYIGGSSGNSLVLSNSAAMNDSCINISGGPSNQVVVTGNNTICNASTVTVAGCCPTGMLRIRNGGQMLGNLYASIDSYDTANGVIVADSGSRWAGIGQLIVGVSGDGGHLLISNSGIVQAAQATVGIVGLSNTVTIVNGGELIVTNSLGNALLTLPHGTIVLSDGTVMGNSITISNQSQITGCGTITGDIKNFGTLTVTCLGGTLTLNGIVTNNGTIIATNNADFEFFGPVVNNGTIDVVNGYAHFPGGFVNHGTYVDAGSVLKPPGLNFSGADVVISFGCVSGKTYAVEYTDDLASSNWLVLAGDILGNGGYTQFPDTGAASLTQRFYRVHLTLP